MNTIDCPPPFCSSSLHPGHLYEYSLLYPYICFNDSKIREKKLKNSNYLISKLNLPRKDFKITLGVDVNGLPITKSALKDPTPIPLKEKCDKIVKENTSKFIDIYKPY